MFFGGGIQLQELVKHNKKSCDSWANRCKLQPAQIGQTVKLRFFAPLRAACVTVQALLLLQCCIFCVLKTWSEKKIHHILSKLKIIQQGLTIIF